jgi:hypothetical protein
MGQGQQIKYFLRPARQMLNREEGSSRKAMGVMIKLVIMASLNGKTDLEINFPIPESIKNLDVLNTNFINLCLAVIHHTYGDFGYCQVYRHLPVTSLVVI